MSSHIRLAIWWACLLVLIVAVPSLSAQSTLASLTGTLVDGTGAAVPGASVTITHLGTQASRTTVTDAGGAYLFNNLDAGPYSVNTSVSGFAEARHEAELLARQTVRVDVRLVVGGVQEQIEVRGASPIIETD